MDFSTFELHPRIEAGVRAQGYDTPTPIQAEAIPPALEGADILGLAQTGTGKTAAFALPILDYLIDGPRTRVRALVIAPTRELTHQIHTAFSALGAETGLRSVPIYGGVNIDPQIRRLQGGAEIVVACPGRLLDHMQQGTAELADVEVLVLDEADRLFDMGFLPDIRRIIRRLPEDRQTLLFSATMPPDIRTLATEILSDPVTVEVDRARPAETVAHAIYPVTEGEKGEALVQLLYRFETESVLVFTRTKRRAKRVAAGLVSAGFDATCLQGNLSQHRRQEALDGFRSGKYPILVATDIAARGIDVSSISHVINYDMPDTVDAYTHRIGRTGRAARTGDAFTLVTPDDASAVRAIERMMGCHLERRPLDASRSSPANDRAAVEPAPRRAPRSRPAPRREENGAPAPRRRRRRRRGGQSKGNGRAVGVANSAAFAAVESRGRRRGTPTPRVTGIPAATHRRGGRSQGRPRAGGHAQRER